MYVFYQIHEELKKKEKIETEILFEAQDEKYRIIKIFYQ